jgi:hypothetical protein
LAIAAVAATALAAPAPAKSAPPSTHGGDDTPRDHDDRLDALRDMGRLARFELHTWWAGYP